MSELSIDLDNLEFDDHFELNELDPSGEQLDEELLQKLLNNDIDNEETLFSLVETENIPRFVLNKNYINDKRFDIFSGVFNLIRRLLRIHDDIINQWMGINPQDTEEIVSILSFVFDIWDKYHERLCLAEMFELSDLCFSVYDYSCSVICSFVMTLNDEQLDVAEEVLFENLLSPVLTKALLASDVICFMCRISKSTFAYNICNVLFQLLNEIYTEDVEIKDLKALQYFYNYQLTQEIMLNLLNRVLAYFDQDEMERFLNDFPLSEYSFIWKNLNISKISNLSTIGDLSIYCKLFLQTKSNLNLSNIDTIVNNFAKNNDNYFLLLYLRILENIKFNLSFSNMEIILQKIKNNIPDITLFYSKSKIFCNILKILKPLALTQDENYQDKSFIELLADVLWLVYLECRSNFITKSYFLVTLQNILSNLLFINFGKIILTKAKLRIDFEFHLRYAEHGRFDAIEEREVYITNFLKKFFENEEIDRFDLEDLSLIFDFPNLLKRGLDYAEAYESSKRRKSSGSVDNIDNDDMQTNNQLICHLESSISFYNNIDSITKEEKDKLTTILDQLIGVITSIKVN